MSLTYAEAEKLFELYTTCVVSIHPDHDHAQPDSSVLPRAHCAASGRLLTTGPEPERIEL